MGSKCTGKKCSNFLLLKTFKKANLLYNFCGNLKKGKAYFIKYTSLYIIVPKKIIA